MVMRLNFESSAPTIPDIDNPRVFAGRDNDALALCRQSLEMNARRLVRTMLGPHDRKDTELNEVRLSPEQFCYAREFFRGKVVLTEYFRSDHVTVSSEQ